MDEDFNNESSIEIGAFQSNNQINKTFDGVE
jgi:hypothetical protein